MAGALHTASTRVSATGAASPLGASVLPGGVNFSVFSKHATLIELQLFDDEAAATPSRTIHSMGTRTVPTTTGTPSSPASSRVRCMDIGRTVRSRQAVDFDSTRRGCSSTHTVLLSLPAGYDRAAACRPSGHAAVAMKSGWPIPLVTTGRAIDRSSARSPKRSSTNFTCAVLRVIPARAFRPRREGHTPE